MLNDKSSMTRLFRSMKKVGLIRQRRIKSDRRIYYPYLSDSGKQLFQCASVAQNMCTKDRSTGLDIDVEALVGDLVVKLPSLERNLKRGE